jgi:hypothetical protein
MAGQVKARMGVRTASIEATVIRADGRVERLGVVSFYHRNPLMRLSMRVVIFIKEKLRWLRS